MSFWKWLYSNMRTSNTPAKITSRDFANLPFKTHWNRLVTMFDLRMYYVLNSHNNSKSLKYTWELEKLHNELNYLHMRSMLKRFSYFFLASLIFFSLYEMPEYDWADNYEPKHEFHTYIELEDGGDEGEDE